jgi:hypothetical protein
MTPEDNRTAAYIAALFVSTTLLIILLALKALKDALVNFILALPDPPTPEERARKNCEDFVKNLDKIEIHPRRQKTTTIESDLEGVFGDIGIDGEDLELNADLMYDDDDQA